jgi:rare lipoprotein A
LPLTRPASPPRFPRLAALAGVGYLALAAVDVASGPRLLRDRAGTERGAAGERSGWEGACAVVAPGHVVVEPSIDAVAPAAGVVTARGGRRAGQEPAAGTAPAASAPEAAPADPAPPVAPRASVSPPPPVDAVPPATHRPGRALASWYGRRFHGRPTASGEPFDMQAYTAAHRTLPFGTPVEVRNPRNGRAVVVRINDRGPRSRRREIDLSYAAARDLGIARRGTARVELRVLR